MKRKYTEGSSLIEVLVAIVILALIVVPTCTSLVMSSRINAKAEQLLQDQLAVSSAVETLMATGVSGEIDEETAASTYQVERIAVTPPSGDDNVCTIVVEQGEVSVTTQVRWTGGGT